jgi:hypothetical protein
MIVPAGAMQKLSLPERHGSCNHGVSTRSARLLDPLRSAVRGRARQGDKETGKPGDKECMVLVGGSADGFANPD